MVRRIRSLTYGRFAVAWIRTEIVDGRITVWVHEALKKPLLSAASTTEQFNMVQPNHNHSSRERFNISRLAIAAPWLTLSFWLAVTVAGILAFSSLKYALFPDIAFPVVVVNASAPLATALETEQQLTRPIEQTLRSLPGLDNSQSSTYPSQAAVSVSFKVGTSLETATRDVERLMKNGDVAQKPGTFKVISLNLNESAAVSYVIDSPSRSLADLTIVANNQIVPAIAKLPGVLKVSLLGTGGAASNARSSFCGSGSSGNPSAI